MTEDERKLVYEEHRCPACNAEDNWYGGPEGGMSKNYECAQCGLRICVDPIGLVAMIIKGPDIERCNKEGIKLYNPSELASQFPRPKMQEIGKSPIALEEQIKMRYSPVTTVAVAMIAGFAMGLIVMGALWILT